LNRAAGSSQISRELKALAKELNRPLIALSQLSRAPENRHRPSPATCRLARVGRDRTGRRRRRVHLSEESTTAAMTTRTSPSCIVAKQRNGPTDTVYLAFLNQFAKFTDLDREALGQYLARFDRSNGSPRINRGGDEF
jgi:replicative DNA helicase